MKILAVDLRELSEDPRNARTHPAKNLDAIRSSLQRFGQVEPLVVQQSTHKVIGGNGRLGIMRELGWNNADCVFVDLDDRRAAALGLALNRSAELAEWNDERLSELLSEVDAPLDLGWDSDDLGSLLDEPAAPPSTPPEQNATIATIKVADLPERLSLQHGDALDVLRTLGDDTVDALVTDPPAGISFMGKGWDGDKGGRDEWIDWLASIMAEALRVLKPGAHGLIWSIPRTAHWTGTALELSGFEVRDCVSHLFGTGFPKSLDVGNGFGTGLKPAAELWWLVRKPLDGTVAANVVEHGTGALNVDGCRIGTTKRVPGSPKTVGASAHTVSLPGVEGGSGHDPNVGRWPANVVVSHSIECTDDACADGCAVAELDGQSGESGTAAVRFTGYRKGGGDGPSVGIAGTKNAPDQYGDTGGASRFFYCPKPSTAERDDGLGDRPVKEGFELAGRKAGSKGASNPRASQRGARRNVHPTVKPVALMRWLVRLITPPGGIVIDPFLGSGTTGIAALAEGMRFVGVEREAEYFEIARDRILAEAAREIDG